MRWNTALYWLWPGPKVTGPESTLHFLAMEQLVSSTSMSTTMRPWLTRWLYAAAHWPLVISTLLSLDHGPTKSQPTRVNWGLGS